MATYRVSEAGATVFDHEGREVTRLAPGYVVVEGIVIQPGSPAYEHDLAIRRQRGYADKMLRPSEDKRGA